MEYRNKNIVIAGGASGLGLALTKMFLEKGSRLFVLDINLEHLEHCRKANVGREKQLFTQQVDVSDLSCLEPIINKIDAVYPIDCMISSIGCFR